MSIFGKGNFKMTGTGDPDYALTEIQYSKLVNPQYQIPDLIERINPITGERYYNLRGNYASFPLLYNVWKEADDVAATQNIYRYLNKKLILQPRGVVILDDNTGTPVNFTLISAKPQPFAELSENDVLVMQFESNNYVDISQSLT
jgi:hypothetical protein